MMKLSTVKSDLMSRLVTVVCMSYGRAYAAQDGYGCLKMDLNAILRSSPLHINRKKPITQSYRISEQQDVLQLGILEPAVRRAGDCMT